MKLEEVKIRIANHITIASFIAMSGLVGCRETIPRTATTIDSVQPVTDSARKDSVRSRIVSCTWSDLEILVGLYKPGPDTFRTLRGMLYAERIPSIWQETAKRQGVYINDSSVAGNRYSLFAELRQFDSLNNTFRPDTQGVGLVNGKHFYGTDGDTPKSQFGEISISRNGRRVSLPRASYGDLYNPGTSMTMFESIDTPQRWYLYMFGSDGAGGYYVVWIFDGNKYRQRIVANDF